jgi:hypothetical protein
MEETDEVARQFFGDPWLSMHQVCAGSLTLTAQCTDSNHFGFLGRASIIKS